MTAFIRPSLILRMDLDERLFNDECVSDIKRSYSYVAPSLVQAHKQIDGQRPENVMRFMIKLHRAYWDKSDEAAQQLWEGVMPKWLHNMFSKVSTPSLPPTTFAPKTASRRFRITGLSWSSATIRSSR